MELNFTLKFGEDFTKECFCAVLFHTVDAQQSLISTVSSALAKADPQFKRDWEEACIAAVRRACEAADGLKDFKIVDDRPELRN